HRDPNEKSIRLATWNVLAPIYAYTDFALEKMFPHCPREAVHYAHRKPLIAEEILRLNPDILAIHECGEDMYADLFLPMMTTLNYGSLICQKLSEAREGVALFYRNDKFQLIRHDRVIFREGFVSHFPPSILSSPSSMTPNMKLNDSNFENYGLDSLNEI